MSLEGLRSGQSFTVREVKPETTKAELLKSLENNGKADIVLEDKGKTFVISGEKIDKKELSNMLKGSANTNTDLFREESALYQMSNKNGTITEKDLKWGMGKVVSTSFPFMAQKISDETSLGALSGTLKGQTAGMYVGKVGVSVGGFLGGALGGTLGFVKGLFTAPVSATIEGSKALGTYHTQKDYNGFHGRITTMR